jgi:hypothetical protein
MRSIGHVTEQNQDQEKYEDKYAGKSKRPWSLARALMYM